MSEINTEHLPYELLSEQLAKEKLEHIIERYGNDPHVIYANLHLILQEHGHDCVEMGMSIAESFPSAGPADMIEAFAAGVQMGKLEGGN